MVATKVCFKCLVPKPLSEFYPHPRMADGHLNKCKDCAKIDVKQNYRDNRDHYVEYEKGRWPRKKPKDQARKQTPEYREYKKRWREQNAEKVQAHALVAKAIRSGELVRQPCQECGAYAKGHHPDYSKPLEVVWLCDGHHRLEHSRLRGIAA